MSRTIDATRSPDHVQAMALAWAEQPGFALRAKPLRAQRAGERGGLLVVGRFVYWVNLPTSTIRAVALTAVVGPATFCILGYALSTTIGSADAAQPMVQAIMLPLYFISGVFIPNVNLPPWLRRVAGAFPVQHLADGLHHADDPAVHGMGIVWSDLAVLAVWAVARLAVALRKFNWTPAGCVRSRSEEGKRAGSRSAGPLQCDGSVRCGR